MAKKSGAGIVIFVGLGLVFLALLAIALRMEGSKEGRLGDLASTEGIGVLPLSGVIVDSRDFIDDLIAFRDDDGVKAIVVRADSPGGAVGPSQELFAEIRKVDAKKPVIFSVGALCASGCYYAAVGSRRIFTNPGSLIGSIGVIMPLFEAKGLFDWAMIHPQFIKSGAMKAAGHPAIPLTPEEAAALQAVVDDTHRQFVGAVAEGRGFAGMTTASVSLIADGRVFTGLQAKGLGMVDEVGTLRDAVAYAGKLAKLSGEPKMIEPKEKRKPLLQYLLEGAHSSIQGAVVSGLKEITTQNAPATQFLWKP